MEHVVPGGGEGATGGRDNSGPYFDDDGGTLLGLGGSVTGPSYDLGRGGRPAEHRLSPQAGNRWQGQEAGEREYSPAEAAREGGDYPWSDERRSAWSRGSGGRAARHLGRGNHDDADLSADQHRGELRWDDVLIGGERDGLSAGGADNGDGATEAIRFSEGCRGGGPEAHLAGNHGLLPLPAEGAAAGSVSPEPFSRLSLRKLSSAQRRREHVRSSPTRRAMPLSAEASRPPHPDGDRRSLNGEVGGDDGVGGGGGGGGGGGSAGAGARFSLWSSSDEDASVTEVFGGDEHGVDEGGDSGDGGLGYGVPAGESNWLASKSGAATSGHDVPSGVFSSVMASAGSFFDAATSSADKVYMPNHV